VCTVAKMVFCTVDKEDMVWRNGGWGVGAWMECHMRTSWGDGHSSAQSLGCIVFLGKHNLLLCFASDKGIFFLSNIFRLDLQRILIFIFAYCRHWVCDCRLIIRILQLEDFSCCTSALLQRFLCQRLLQYMFEPLVKLFRDRRPVFRTGGA
jgi:hypothetical protein